MHVKPGAELPRTHATAFSSETRGAAPDLEPRPSRRRRLYAVSAVLLSLAAGLGLAELGVRFQERRHAIGEQRRSRYEEAYQASAFRTGELGDAGFLAPGFSGLVTDELGRPVEWVHNSLGFRSRREYARRRPPGVLRILALGDSFVVGHRLGQEDTVPAQVEAWLGGEGSFPGAEVLVAAIEEPATGLYYLERHGLAFEPQVVMLGLTLGNDIAQVYFNLGASGHYRLEPPGSAPALVLNPDADRPASLARVEQPLLPPEALSGPGPGPPAVPAPGPPSALESRFHLLRFVRQAAADRRDRATAYPILSIWNEYARPRLFDGNGLGMYLEPAPPETERAYELLFALLAAYDERCRAHGARFLLAVHAQRYQLQPADWQATVAGYGLEPRRFDLMAANRRLARFCRERGITCFDPTAAMAERHAREGRSFFMPRGDMHWNTRGSRTFFELIRSDLAAALAPLRPPAPS